MGGRRLTGVLGSGVALLLVVAALVCLPATGSASSAHVSTLTIERIHAEFSSPDRATTYSVAPITSVGVVSRHWTLTLEAIDPAVNVDGLTFDANCDNHGVLSGTDPTFVWHHGNIGDPVHDDGCNHDLQGKYGHQGLITVTVTDVDGSQCVTTYKGTFSSSEALDLGLDITTEPVCTGPTTTPPPPPPPPPPPAKPCKCALLTARIVPSSVKLERLKKKRVDVSLVVHWVMTCSKGKGESCRGQLVVSASRAETPDGVTHIWRVRDAFLGCQGSCGGVHDGGARFLLEGGRFTQGELEKLGRISITIERRCQARTLRPVKLWITFDKSGEIDIPKSKLR